MNGNNGSIPTAFYASRPRLRIDGRLIEDLGDSLLISLFVEESTMGLFHCEANFLNWGPRDGQVGFLFFDRDTLDFGFAGSVLLKNRNLLCHCMELLLPSTALLEPGQFFLKGVFVLL